MHELSITRSIVEICEERAGGRRISQVVLLIGQLSGVVPESIDFCFEACSRGTLAEGARLTMETVPAVGNCPHCSSSTRMTSILDPCASCGNFGLQIVSGRELRVREITVD